MPKRVVQSVSEDYAPSEVYREEYGALCGRPGCGHFTIDHELDEASGERGECEWSTCDCRGPVYLAVVVGALPC